MSGVTPGLEDLALRLKTLTCEMLRLAEADDWEAVATCEAERQGVIEALFAAPLPDELMVQLEGYLQQIVAANVALLKLGQGRRDQLGEQLQSVQAGRKARAAYADVNQS